MTLTTASSHPELLLRRSLLNRGGSMFILPVPTAQRPAPPPGRMTTPNTAAARRPAAAPLPASPALSPPRTPAPTPMIRQTQQTLYGAMWARSQAERRAGQSEAQAFLAWCRSHRAEYDRYRAAPVR